MKISDQLYRELAYSVRVPASATMRQRWDALWASGFDVSKLYAQGLNDDHIDTALRKLASHARHR